MLIYIAADFIVVLFLKIETKVGKNNLFARNETNNIFTSNQLERNAKLQMQMYIAIQTRYHPNFGNWDKLKKYGGASHRQKNVYKLIYTVEFLTAICII